MNDLGLWYLYESCTCLVDCIYRLWFHRLKEFLKPEDYKSHKIGQGQPRVIIWTNLVLLKYPMLHLNFQGHRPFGYREEFFIFLPYMGMAAILVMWPRPFEQTFVPPSHGTGRGSSIGSEFAWHASGPEFDPHVRHILSWRLGHENISTAILPLPLIQEEQLSVTGERMCTKYW